MTTVMTDNTVTDPRPVIRAAVFLAAILVPAAKPATRRLIFVKIWAAAAAAWVAVIVILVSVMPIVLA
jgi:hypothetical protein